MSLNGRGVTMVNEMKQRENFSEIRLRVVRECFRWEPVQWLLKV